MCKLNDAVLKLDQVKHSLWTNDLKFADSLISYYRKKGSLSAKQEPWIYKLIEKAENLIAGVQKMRIEIDLDTSKIFAFFENGEKKLKKPFIVLSIKDKDVKFSRAGERSRRSGDIVVAGRAWKEAFYGYLTKNGKFIKGRDDIEGLEDLIRQLADNPAKTAAENGKKYGRCCFCYRPLSNQDRSIKVGYGPICAKNHDLPW